MTRQELGQSLNLIEELIPKENANRNGRGLRPSKIAIHNTNNPSRGADASAHSRYLIRNAGDSGHGPTSWHYTVDDKRVVKHLPLGERGMHAYASGNSISLGIEMCMNSDGDWEKTVDRTARLVAALCFDFGWTVAAVMQHHDFPRRNGTRKNCPSQIRSSGIAPDWDGFITLIDSYLSAVLNSEGFTGGFSASKEASAILQESRTNLTRSDLTRSAGDDSERDHGDIRIPDDLLSR